MLLLKIFSSMYEINFFGAFTPIEIDSINPYDMGRCAKLKFEKTKIWPRAYNSTRTGPGGLFGVRNTLVVPDFRSGVALG